MNLLKTMEYKKDQFSNAEKKVYDFIMRDPKQVETYTITRLANLANTSTSAVLRFCQTLGFDGYKDFRYELINELKSQTTPISSNQFSSLIDHYINSLNSFKSIDQKDIKHLVDDIKNASSISIGGLYYSSLPAKQLSYGLQDIGYTNHLAADYLELSHHLDVVDPHGVFIYFSVTGGTNNVLHYLIPELKKSLPEHSYLITLNNKSSLSAYFGNTIVLPGTEVLRNSIIDNESMSSIFVELLINMISN